MPNYKISGEVDRAMRITLLDAENEELIGYRDVNEAGPYECIFEAPTLRNVSVTGEVILGDAITYGQVEPILTVDPVNVDTGFVSTWRFGSGVPSNDLGVNGDQYLRSNGDVYKKVGGTYTITGINIKGDKGDVGEPLTPTEIQDNFTESTVAVVEGGTYSPTNLYISVIINDNRSNTTTPINGDLTNHVIVYDGTSWTDVGLFTGTKGDTGDTGATGATGPQGPAGADGADGIANVNIGTEMPPHSLGEDGDTYLQSGGTKWTKNSTAMARWADNGYYTLTGDGVIATLNTNGTHRCLDTEDNIPSGLTYCEFLIEGLDPNTEAYIGLVESNWTNDGSNIKDLTTTEDRFWISTGDNNGTNLNAYYGINTVTGTLVNQTHTGSVRIGIAVDKATGEIWARYNDGIDIGYISEWESDASDEHWQNGSNYTWTGSAWQRTIGTGLGIISAIDWGSVGDWTTEFQPTQCRITFTGSPNSIEIRDNNGVSMATAVSPASPHTMDITFNGDPLDNQYAIGTIEVDGGSIGDQITNIEFYYSDPPTGWVGNGDPDGGYDPTETISAITSNNYVFVFCTDSNSVTCEMVANEQHMSFPAPGYNPFDSYRWTNDGVNLSTPYRNFPTIDDVTDPYNHYEMRPWESVFVDTYNGERVIILPQERGGQGYNEYDLVDGMQIRIIDFDGNASADGIRVESIDTKIEDANPDKCITINDDWGILEMIYSSEQGWIQISYPRRQVKDCSGGSPV